MKHFSHGMKTLTTLALAVACGGVVLLWPNWQAELRAKSSYTPPHDDLLSALCEEATAASDNPACTGLCVAAVQVCCDGEFPDEEGCSDKHRNERLCQRLTNLLLRNDCGLELNERPLRN